MRRAVKKLVFVFVCVLVSNGVLYTQEKSVSDIVEEAMPSVVLIVIYDKTGDIYGVGSGFFIEPGKILTNAHVVEDAYSAEVSSENEYYDQITVLKSDIASDLALIEVEDRGEPVLEFEEEEKIRPGQRVIVIGNPLGLEKTISDGLISAIRAVDGKPQAIQISAPISPGSSGGPLLNLNGRVIGVASASIVEGQNLNFAIGVDAIKGFLSISDSPKKLQIAMSRIMWRFIIKWIIKIVGWIIAFALGGAWWIILIIILLITFFGWLGKTIFHLIKRLFRRRRKVEDNKEVVPSDRSEFLSSSNSYNSYDIEDEYTFAFYCWKCGERIVFDLNDKPERVECETCGTILTVPEE